jgi:NAD+ dependent glucose-6-phosphate dehydrogenase
LADPKTGCVIFPPPVLPVTPPFIVLRSPDGRTADRKRRAAEPPMADAIRRGSVLITGAAGVLGRLLVRKLPPSYSLSLLDRRALPAGTDLPCHPVDLAQPQDLAACLNEVDTVIHLAGIPTGRASWEELIESNVLSTEHLLREARRHGCRRVILASSVQVMDGYPPGTDITPDLPVWPVNNYGASKACAETVAERFGRRGGMSVVCLRLGWVLPRHDWRITPWSPYLDRVLTEADFVRAMSAALQRERDAGFEIHHILSDNRSKRLNIDSARAVLGFSPQDDSFAVARTNIPGMAVSGAIRLRRCVKGLLGAAYAAG